MWNDEIESVQNWNSLKPRIIWNDRWYRVPTTVYLEKESLINLMSMLILNKLICINIYTKAYNGTCTFYLNYAIVSVNSELDWLVLQGYI